jgi:NADPH-dependent 2,4-dienoyl-CoA reductase/sulfur reductase-like enzyme
MARFDRSSAQSMLRSTVVDAVPGATLTVAGPDGGRVVRARATILATGARELFLPFPGWTLPNVIGAGGAQALIKGGLEVRNRRVVVAGSGPLLLPVAAALRAAGALLVGVAEQASRSQLLAFGASLWTQPAKLSLAALYAARISPRRYHPGTWVTRAEGIRRVERVTLSNGRREWTEPCDLLCCSYGLVPATELAELLGCEIVRRRVVVDQLQWTSVPGVLCAGEGTGVAGDDAAIIEGEIAGLVAAGAMDAGGASMRYRRGQNRGRLFSDRLARRFAPRHDVLALSTPDTIVCRCEDVRFEQLDPRWSGRQAKLYSRIGMGPCQGAVCGAAAEHIFGWEATRVRPPLFSPPIESWVDARAHE